MTSTPDSIAAAVIAFEDHRTLEPALAATLAHQRAERIRAYAIAGADLAIVHIMSAITGARDPAAKAALEEQLAAAHGDVDALRAVDVAELRRVLGGAP